MNPMCRHLEEPRSEVDVPLVTVIVTVFTRVEFLPQALASVLNQTFSELEVIVMDDSGCAMAHDICEPFVRSNGVLYRANPGTLGVAASLRGAMCEAKGKYLAVLNDDDAWGPDFLENLVPILESDSRRVLAFSDHWIMTEDGRRDVAATDAVSLRYGRAALPEGRIGNTAEFVLVHNGVPLAMAALFRKRALDPLLLTSQVAGAYDFWISCILAKSGGEFYYVPRRLTSYRIHTRMETGRRGPDKSDNHVYIFSQLLERDWFPDRRRYLRLKLSRALCRASRDRLDFGRAAEARRFVLEALRIAPGWRPVAVALLSFVPHALRRRLELLLGFPATWGPALR